MRIYFTKIAIFCLVVFCQVAHGQQIKIPIKPAPTLFQQYDIPVDTLYITGSNGNVANSGIQIVPLGSSYTGNNGNNLSEEEMIQQVMNNTPTEKYLKAKSGEALNINLKFMLKLGQNNNYNNFEPFVVTRSFSYQYSPSLDDASSFEGYYGQEDTPNGIQQNYKYLDQISSESPSSDGRKVVEYSTTLTFQMGRFKSWYVFEFGIWQLDQQSNTPIYKSYIAVIPFVVEGPLITPSQANPVAIKGYIREPAIPQMILHNPPGDMSSVTFQTLQEACRSMSESVTLDESNNGRLNLTLGIAGSAGLFVSVNYEFSVTASLSGGGGSTLMKSNGRQNCVSILNSISTAPGNARANEGSIYLGYSSTVAYGLFPIVAIKTGPTVEVVRDSSIIFGLVPGSATPFYYSKNDILYDIAQNQSIINNLSFSPKMRREALNQNRIWDQVLKKDSININDPAAPVLVPPFTITGGNSGPNTTTITQSISETTTYDVSHFLEVGVGASFVVKVGGSGVDGGYEFKTKKTMGASVANTNNSSTTISYTLQDNDLGDSFRIKVIKDKTYGTPIFLLDEAQSRTSCPYEGGYQRDKPKLEINGSTSPTVTISNVSLGTSGNFRVKICNNSNEIKDYGFGFIGESIVNDVSITSTAGIGSSPTGTSITKLATITAVPANGCKTTTYDVNIARRNPASPMSYQNIEFVTYAECEPSIKSSIYANINFAGPPPPTGVAASKSEVCVSNPLTLTANCPVATTPNWYTVAEGGFPIAVGASVVVNPTENTTYYVGCETPDYKRDRVATPLVLVGSPSTALNLTSNITSSTLQIANTTITARNKIFSPATVTYKAGNSLTFTPGFEANAGTNFTAKIGGCAN